MNRNREEELRSTTRMPAITSATVVRFRPELRDAFERLNRQWIEEYFSVEEPDRAVFRDPDGTILRPGGEIFFVLADGDVVGTCAMVQHGHDAFELAKMAVDPSARGLGHGDRLIVAAIDFARERGAARVELLTNSMLVPALRLYEKHGFRRVPVSAREGNYVRADTKMVLELAHPVPATNGPEHP
jgi:putative acetyltransferase